MNAFPHTRPALVAWTCAVAAAPTLALAQGPAADDVAAIPIARIVAMGPRRMADARERDRLAVAPTFDPADAVERGSRMRFQPFGSGGVGVVGTAVGTAVGFVVGPSVLTGHDLGCDDIVCYGRLSRNGAAVAGAVVGGSLGLLGSTIIDAVDHGNLRRRLPLRGVRLTISPRGAPGVRLTTSIRF